MSLRPASTEPPLASAPAAVGRRHTLREVLGAGRRAAGAAAAPTAGQYLNELVDGEEITPAKNMQESDENTPWRSRFNDEDGPKEAHDGNHTPTIEELRARWAVATLQKNSKEVKSIEEQMRQLRTVHPKARASLYANR